MPDERLFLEICNINIQSTRFPIPVLPLIDFPELVRVVDAIENEFEWLRNGIGAPLCLASLVGPSASCQLFMLKVPTSIVCATHCAGPSLITAVYVLHKQFRCYNLQVSLGTSTEKLTAQSHKMTFLFVIDPPDISCSV